MDPYRATTNKVPDESGFTAIEISPKYTLDDITLEDEDLFQGNTHKRSNSISGKYIRRRSSSPTERTRINSEFGLESLKYQNDTKFKRYIKKPIVLFLLLMFAVVITILLATSNGSSNKNKTFLTGRPSGYNFLDGSNGKAITLEDINSNKFITDSTGLRFITYNGQDGYHLIQGESAIMLANVKNNNLIKLIPYKVFSQSGEPIVYVDSKLSPTVNKALLVTNVSKGWRYSIFADYWVYDIGSKTVEPLTKSKSDKLIPGELGAGKVSLVTWSPDGNRIAWVRDNDIFVYDGSSEESKEIRITNDGSKNIINGISDWVYEEEVLKSHFAMWFSPDSKRLAFFKFDESLVHDYVMPKYASNPNASYPENILIRYPKPGSPNPKVYLYIADPDGVSEKDKLTQERKSKPLKTEVQQQDTQNKTDTNSSYVTTDEGIEKRSTSNDKNEIAIPVDIPASLLFEDDDRIFVEVVWTKGHEELLVRMTNRVQDKQRLLLVKNEAINGKDKWVVQLLREENETDGGWITRFNTITPIRLSPEHDTESYVEIKENEDGFAHIAYYESVSSNDFTWLTFGNYEIDEISAIDSEEKLIYFTSSEGDSTQRHLFSVSYDTKIKIQLTPPKDLINNRVKSVIPEQSIDLGNSIPDKYVGKKGFYSARFSPLAKYYVLDYSGPDVPITMLYSTSGDLANVVVNNNELRKELGTYDLPTYKFFTIPSTDENMPDMNIQFIFPPGFDETKVKKYPVLFNIYGGPNSQTVQQKFKLDIHYALSSSAGFIIVKVDGRGTGFNGRKFRSAVSKHLGTNEVKDYLEAAKFVGNLSYVDSDRIGIWGWSYGGFLTSKVIEANSGLFSLAMAVAPVTDWRYYDSVYTERFMKTPEINSEGYAKSAITDMEGFKNVDFLLAHGTGDDNVHFQNSATLVYKLTGAHVSNYRMQMYTDSNHSINDNGAREELYKLLYKFITSKFGIFKE